MDYQTAVSDFIELNAAEVEERLEEGKETILFIGKPTCPFCQRFVPKLKHVQEENGLTVHYLNSINTQTDSQIKALRDKLNVPLVPQVVTITGPGEFRNLNIDSSASEEKLTELLVK